MSKTNLFLQKKNVVEIPYFFDNFPKCGAILKKKGLAPEGKITVKTCLNESMPNMIYFSDETKKTVPLQIEVLTEKEANALAKMIKNNS
jgi:hypothetical protein